MASNLKSLSDYSAQNLTDFSNKHFGIVVSEWNSEITEKLLEGAHETLLKHGVTMEHIYIKTVPGSYELSLASQWMAQWGDIDAVICLGCIIKGETPHFEFISAAVAHGITDVALKYNKPIIFGVLTTENQQQALDRSGGKYGNKGVEAAATALKMLGF
jgi:6,7-dimethyl-8-ribityllumazine synthase